MALSDYELQVLAQMEEHLSDEDPHLAGRMRSGPGGRSRPRQVALGVILLLLGVCTLLTGLFLTPQLGSLQLVGSIVGVVGFILMVIGMLTIFGIIMTKKSPTSGAYGAKTAKSRPSQKASFMQRQEDKRDRRRTEH